MPPEPMLFTESIMAFDLDTGEMLWYDQAMSADEQGDEHVVDHRLLAHDDFGQLVFDAFVGLNQFVDECGVFFRGRDVGHPFLRGVQYNAFAPAPQRAAST